MTQIRPRRTVPDQMMRTSYTRVAVAVTVAVLLAVLVASVPGAAHAQHKSSGAKRGKASSAEKSAEKSAEPSADTKEKARAAYARGQSAFSAGHYDEALAAFQEAFAAVPNPIVLLSISESQAKLERVEAAIGTLRFYLEARADAPNRADIEAKITELSATPAMLAVTTEPAGAELSVDGLPTQKLAPAQLKLAPGGHEIHYTLHGYHAGTEAVKLTPGGKHELRVMLEALPVPPPAAVAAAALPAAETNAAPPAATTPSGRSTTAIWVTAGIGAAGLVTGTVLGFLAMSEQHDFNQHPTTATADRGERYALFADVGFGVGVMAIATAAVLYLTGDDAPNESAPNTASATRLPRRLALAPASGSATALLHF